jgi:hypothetical protein
MVIKREQICFPLIIRSEGGSIFPRESGRVRAREKGVDVMELQKIEEEMKKMVASLDKGTRLETILVEEDEYRVVLSRGTHSDRASLSKELLEDFLERGKRGHEVKKVLGKVISKLTRLGQRRG